MPTIDIIGVIVSDDEKRIYELIGYQCVCPKDVKRILLKANGSDVLVRINSPGGSVHAASEIYTDLKGYSGQVNIQIQGIAASAASFIAMAGKCEISPTATVMIHNVSTGARGDHRAMDHMANILRNLNKSICNAYMIKTRLPESKILKFMDDETWFTADDAVSLGFADSIMFKDKNVNSNTRIMGNSKNNQEQMKAKVYVLQEQQKNLILKRSAIEEANKQINVARQVTAQAQLDFLKLKAKGI